MSETAGPPRPISRARRQPTIASWHGAVGPHPPRHRADAALFADALLSPALAARDAARLL